MSGEAGTTLLKNSDTDTMGSYGATGVFPTFAKVFMGKVNNYGRCTSFAN
jgi:hypothetical protein